MGFKIYSAKFSGNNIFNNNRCKVILNNFWSELVRRRACFTRKVGSREFKLQLVSDSKIARGTTNRRKRLVKSTRSGAWALARTRVWHLTSVPLGTRWREPSRTCENVVLVCISRPTRRRLFPAHNCSPTPLLSSLPISFSRYSLSNNDHPLVCSLLIYFFYCFHVPCIFSQVFLVFSHFCSPYRSFLISMVSRDFRYVVLVFHVISNISMSAIDCVRLCKFIFFINSAR